MLPSRRPSWLGDDVELVDRLHVFVPGLMGAGLIVSMAMIVADSLRRLVPVGGRGRAVRLAIRAAARARDFESVLTGVPPVAPRVATVPRERHASLVLGALALIAAVLIAGAALDAYQADTGVLARRGWTLSVGLAPAVALLAPAVVLLASALLGPSRPPWLTRLASLKPIGTLPDLDPHQEV